LPFSADVSNNMGTPCDPGQKQEAEDGEMDEHDRHEQDQDAEELLRRALIDDDRSAAVALRVEGLALAQALTVVFHGRGDLGTVQTYVANGGHGAGVSLGAADLLRVPCDLDLGEADSVSEAEELYASQARALRDALTAADTVLAVWREPLEEIAEAAVSVDRSIELQVRLPAHRLMPVALVAPEKRLTIAAVCGARTLAEGRPPLGIACAQQDVAHVYPLPDDPERCLADFAERAAEHARGLAERMDRQDASVRRFLELSGEDFDEAG
jgi:hypothetical protein